jgi:hypothetical protein
MSEERRTTRREMLKSAGRYGALLGLIGGVGTLAARSACRQTPCGACTLLARCDLSKAQEARARSGENGGRS